MNNYKSKMDINPSWNLMNNYKSKMDINPSWNFMNNYTPKMDINPQESRARFRHFADSDIFFKM